VFRFLLLTGVCQSKAVEVVGRLVDRFEDLVSRYQLPIGMMMCVLVLVVLVWDQSYTGRRDVALATVKAQRQGCLRVSSRFYFYILVRNVFRRSGVAERVVADYVAEVLAEFAQSERARCVIPGSVNSLDYFFEMLSALNAADDRTSFFIRAHIGNYSLFFSGVFPDRIRFRAEDIGVPPDDRFVDGDCRRCDTVRHCYRVKAGQNIWVSVVE